MRKKHTPLFILLVIILFSAVAVLLAQPSTTKAPKPKAGVLDLSNWSFEENGSVSLDGEWEFYFNEFLSYEDFEKGVAIAPTLIRIPSTQASMAAYKPIAEDEFYGTMRLVIKLPEHTKPYGVRSDIILTAFRLYIDGQSYGGVGQVGTSPESSIPYYNILNSYFTAKTNQIELIYHASDFSGVDSSIAAPKIGLATQISKEAQLGLGKDLFLFGMLLIMAIYHFGLYFMRSKARAPLYFGIFCLAFSLRMLLVGERFLPSHFYLDFYVYGGVAYLCVFLGVTALCCFLHHAMDGLFPKWFVKSSVVIGLLFSFVMFWVPYRLADALLIAYAVPGFLLIAYAVIRLLIGVIKKHPFANIVLIGFAFLGATFVNDFVYQITLANTPSLIPLGVSVFTFTQAYTLSARFSNAFTRAEQLSQENETILSELKDMNSNLESLVKKRTFDLQRALEEMEVMSKTDYLTKMPNRWLMLEKIQHLIEQKKGFYLAIVDVDHFKEINDSFGHIKGDEILVRLSEILSLAVGNYGFVGRWGGEEFLIVLETDQVDAILEKANEIRLAVEGYRYEDIEKNLTITIGLSKFMEHSSIDAAIANADKALYQGKVSGRNQCIIAT